MGESEREDDKEYRRGGWLWAALILGFIVYNVCTGDGDGEVASTTTPTTAALVLTEREKRCAAEFHPDLSIREDRMLDLKRTPSFGRIHWWSEGFWVSYDKVMEVCDNRDFEPTTTTRKGFEAPTTPTFTAGGTDDWTDEDTEDAQFLSMLTELEVGDTFDYYPAWLLADLGRAVCADLDSIDDHEMVPLMLAVIDAEFEFGEWNTTALVVSSVAAFCPEHQWLIDAWS